MDLAASREAVAEARRNFTSRKRLKDESRQQYAGALKTLAGKCDFGDMKDWIVENQVSGEFTEIPITEPTPMTSTQGDEVNKCLQPPGSPRTVSESTASQTQLLRYKKIGGAADGTGNDYEHEMLSLIFLRMLKAGYEFHLASNMDAAAKFDDIVMRYRKHSDADWNWIFVQLKHRQGENIGIPKRDLVALTGDFSLVKYCHSYEIIKLSKELHSLGNFNDHKLIIFTNASLADSHVYEVEADPLLDTGGKAISFKAGGEVFKELCEWVDIKNALTELHGQVEGLDEKEVTIRIKEIVKNIICERNAVKSCKNELLATPTLVKLKALLAKLRPVKDNATYSSFLAKLQVYSKQAHESELDAKIQEEAVKIWKCSVDLEAGVMLHALKAKVKSWWQKDNFYLTQDSPLWLDVVKSQTETLSRSTIERLTKFKVEFQESSLQILDGRINELSSVGGILHLRVDSRTAASSLRVHQELAKFRPNELVLQVNIKALLEREDDVLSAWATRWCRLLVVECDDHLDQSQAERIGDKILKIDGLKNEKKVFVLIAPEAHSISKVLKGKTSELHYVDSIKWGDLTQASQDTILQTKVNVQGTAIALSDVEKKEKESGIRVLYGKRRFRDCLVEQFDLEIFSQLLNGVVDFGKPLDKVDRIFVSRRLKKSNNVWHTFSVNSLSDFNEKVALLVAEPGMGKSTLITHLANSAKKEDPSAWIVHIKINDCTTYLDSMDKEKLDAEAARNFLEHCALSQGNKLEELLFRSLEHKLIVFVDGVDEVNPHYEKQIFTILSFLKDFIFTGLWVSSRPTFNLKLENVLGVDSINIVEFSVTEQTEFFNKTWKKEDSSISDDKCTEKTESLLKLFDNSLGRDVSIMGVPLMTSMIAEIYNSSIDKFVINGRLDYITLVKTYVERRFEILCNEKMKLENRHLSANRDNEKEMRERIHSNHRLAALRVIFSPEEIKTLKFTGKKDFDKVLGSYLVKVTEGREKTGIIDNVIDDVPHFTHRLFAEYFASMWLASNFKNNPEFTKYLIFHPAYKTLAEMFNRILAENHPLHEAVLHKDVEELECYKRTQTDVNTLDDGGRTALHLALLVSGTDLVIVKILVEKYKARVDIPDSIAGWTPLQYAEQARAWDALEFFLNNGGKNLKGWPKPSPAVMLDAARDANVFVVRYLVVKRRGDLNCRGTEGETMIHTAAEGGNVKMLDYLVTKGLSLYTKDKEQNTTLHYATHHDHVSAVSFLLEQGLDMNAGNSRGLNALQDAAQRGAYEIMTFLLELKSTFKVSSSAKVQLDASLLCAAFAGSLELVQKFVAMGASADHQNNKGHTAARLAINREHNQVLDWLLLNGSVIGSTPLHVACESGKLEIVTFVLSRGDDIEAKDCGERTPLMGAAWKNNLSVMELLLENGANVDASDKSGHTSLHRASWWGYKQAVELMLRHGAQVNKANNEGETALHAAIRMNKLDLVKPLLGNADHHLDDKLARVGRAGVTPLVAAAINGDLDRVKDMLAAFITERDGLSKADYINMKEKLGWTVIHFLARLGQAGMIPYLISQGGDQQTRDKDGNTALNLAARYKSPDTVRVLLNSIADGTFGLDEADRAAAVNSAFMCAVKEGCVECVGLLIMAGGKLTQVDEFGWTPLMLAAVRDDLAVVKLVLRAFNSTSEGILLKDYINMKDKEGLNALDLADTECRRVMEKCLAQI